MSLRERIMVILLILFCGYVGLEYAAFRGLMFPLFIEQERQQAQHSIKSAMNAVNAQFTELDQRIDSNARSGFFYEILQNGALPQRDVETADLDFLLLYDARWNPVWSKLPEGMTIGRLEDRLIGGKSAMISKDLLGYSRSGIVRIDDHYVFVAAKPVYAPANRTGALGTVIAGQAITDKRLFDIRKRFALDFNWEILSDENKISETAAQISRQNPYHFSVVSKQYIQVLSAVFDYQNQPAILIKTFQDKAISDHGAMTMYKLILIKLGAGFAAVLIFTGILQVIIINPILKLIRHVVKIDHPGSAKQKIALSRKDEIGTLADEFDQMCRRVQNAQIKLMEKSYLTGATEMSSGILHNVRNALSPITTRIDRIKDQFQEIPLANLEQAQRELHNVELTPQRREDLMQFVELSFRSVIATLKDMVEGLDELFEQVVQIEDMLNAQRTFGGTQERPVEYVEPARLLDSALEIIPEKLRKTNRIDVASAIKKLPPIPVHPTTFVQILQNLLINAAESLEREKPLYPKISIKCEIEPHKSADMLHWRIRDNGAGIEPDRLECIFERGASSKTQALTGIGLHWCAVTINAMQGRLWAESDGHHCGACFHLLIPMAAAECPAENQNEKG